MKMSWMGLVLGLVLLMVVSSDAGTEGYNHPVNCCFQFARFKIPESEILEIVPTDSHCPVPGYVESGEVPVRKGQGRRSILDAHDLQVLRQPSINHRQDCVLEISAWAQGHVQTSIFLWTFYNHRGLKAASSVHYKGKEKQLKYRCRNGNRVQAPRDQARATVARKTPLSKEETSRGTRLKGKTQPPQVDLDGERKTGLTGEAAYNTY
ncbi:hypothetical protein NFI96_006570 [Prochilodus magdalenae]|nr:hypothetical protein NFI96_006570 [Prochilodus magdalenae]